MILNILKFIFRISVKFFAILFYLSIGKILYLSSKLYRQINSNRQSKCPICQGKNNKFFKSMEINRDLSLFDHRFLARYLYTFSFIPNDKIRLMLCSYDEWVLRFQKTVYINYFECLNCLILYQNVPITINDREEYYSKYYRFHKKFGRPQNYYLGSNYHLWSDYITNSIDSIEENKILDIGCAEGFLVKRLIDKGFNAYGIEPSDAMVNYAHEDLMLTKKVKSGNYNRSSYKESEFDIITSYHVIEHVADAKIFINNINYHLKKGGCFFLSTPCFEALKSISKIPSSNKFIYDLALVPSHPFIFSLKYILKTLTENGFRILNYNIVDEHKKLINDNNKLSFNGDKLFGVSLCAQKL